MKFTWEAKSDDGSFDDNANALFDTQEECYKDMRRAALEKATWNTEPEDFSDCDKIHYYFVFSPMQIVHTSYSGTYTYNLIQVPTNN